MKSLKAALKQRRHKAAAVRGQLRGVEKKHSELLAATNSLRTVLASALPQLHEALTANAISSIDWTSVASAKHVKRIENAMKAETDQLAEVAASASQVFAVLDHQDQSSKEAAAEMQTQRKAVRDFMNDTMRFVDDIARDVTNVRPNFSDNLSGGTKPAPGDDVYVISSLFRLHTRPRDARADGIFARRRGAPANIKKQEAQSSAPAAAATPPTSSSASASATVPAAAAAATTTTTAASPRRR